MLFPPTHFELYKLKEPAPFLIKLPIEKVEVVFCPSFTPALVIVVFSVATVKVPGRVFKKVGLTSDEPLGKFILPLIVIPPLAVIETLPPSPPDAVACVLFDPAEIIEIVFAKLNTPLLFARLKTTDPPLADLYA